MAITFSESSVKTTGRRDGLCRLSTLISLFAYQSFVASNLWSMFLDTLDDICLSMARRAGLLLAVVIQCSETFVTHVDVEHVRRISPEL